MGQREDPTLGFEVILRPQEHCDALVVALSHSWMGATGASAYQALRGPEIGGGLTPIKVPLHLGHRLEGTGVLVRAEIHADPQLAGGPIQEWIRVSQLAGVTRAEPPPWADDLEESSLDWLRDIRHF